MNRPPILTQSWRNSFTTRTLLGPAALEEVAKRVLQRKIVAGWWELRRRRAGLHVQLGSCLNSEGCRAALRWDASTVWTRLVHQGCSLHPSVGPQTSPPGLLEGAAARWCCGILHRREIQKHPLPLATTGRGPVGVGGGRGGCGVGWPFMRRCPVSHVGHIWPGKETFRLKVGVST